MKESMVYLGTVTNITYNGNLIIKSSRLSTIPLNWIVGNNLRQSIGVVKDVVGPVESPYIVVRPFDRSAATHKALGSEVYLLEKMKKRKGDIHGRRRRKKSR